MTMRAKITTTLVVLIGTLGIFSAGHLSAPKNVTSVELGLAETSPRGEQGGFAIPASGGSTPSRPSARLNVSVNGGASQNTSLVVINPGDNIELRWLSTNATLCTGNNVLGDFDTGGALSGSDNTIQEPAPGTFYDYGLTCDGPGGTGFDVVGVETNSPPNVTLSANPATITYGDTTTLDWVVGGSLTPTCSAAGGPWAGSFVGSTGSTVVGPVTASLSGSPPLATVTYGIDCLTTAGNDSDTISVTVESRPDLQIVGVSESVSVSGNPVTGLYSNMDMVGIVRSEYNDIAIDVPYQFSLTRLNDGALFPGPVQAIAGGLSRNANSAISTTFFNLPFGDYAATLELDLATGPPGDVIETPAGIEDTNNVSTYNFTLSQPPPNMSIQASPVFVRRGQVSTLSWAIQVGYEIDCSVHGVGVNRTDIGHDGLAGTNLTASQNTPSLSSETTYTLSCVTPLTGNVYTVNTVVKVLPSVEET